MDAAARRTLAPPLLLALLAAAWLAGCASGPDKQQCLATDWRTVGYEDGLRGFAAERIGVHREACGKHGVAPDLTAYLDGRERGLKEYCLPKNGFRAGLNGGGYANVCSGPTEAAFVDAWRWGRQIHDARSALRQTQAQLNRSREGLAQTNNAMANVTSELVLGKAPPERRAFLVTELVRLAQERTGLAARIDELTIRSQELAANVQQLERQSPYML
jgi:outer membrane murein-binding lipoprotein Lpp